MTKKNSKLGDLRAQIETVDKTILKALSMRVKLVEAIGRYKFAHNMTLLDKKRRDALFAVWRKNGKSLGLPTKLVQDIFSSLHKHSLLIEDGVNKK